MLLEIELIGLGVYIGIFWTIAMLWKRLSKRCWGQVARVEGTHRCMLYTGHSGKHIWYNISRTKSEEW